MGFRIQRNPLLSISMPAPSVRMKINRPHQEKLQIASSAASEAAGQTKETGQAKNFESMLNVERGKGENGRASERWVEYTIQKNDTLWNLAVKRYHVNVEDIIKDNSIEDPRRIQPGQKIRIRLPSYPERTDVIASWYGREHHGKPMANGEKYNMHGATIAHKDLPLGTRVELENPVTRQRVKAVVTDRGPYVEGRDVDLSYGLAQKLSLLEKGVGPLVMRVLG